MAPLAHSDAVAREVTRRSGAGPVDVDAHIVGLVSRGEVKVPPYPAVALRVEALVGGGDYGLDDLAKLIGSDQVIAGDVLRCANWVVYARGSRVVSIAQAITRIGATDVGRIALASGLGSHALAAGSLAPLRRQVWLDSLASALVCQALAPGKHLPPDVAFSAGLLHDYGKVVAIACIEDLLARRDDVPPRPAEEWAAVVERYHVELGVVMAARWDLPEVLSDVISLHHSGPLGAAEPALVEMVQAVDGVVALLGARTHLGAGDLAAAHLLETGEREIAAHVIETLPAFVASFASGEAPPRAEAPTKVAAPPPLPAASPPPPPHPVVLRVGSVEHAYELMGISSTHCMVRGKAPVAENYLVGLRVKSDPEVTGFASVKAAWPEDGAFMLLVQPYALDREALSRWRALVDKSNRAP